jgi:hypothetical protein
MSQAFITYAHADQNAAKRLAADLEKRGIDVTQRDRLVPPGVDLLSQVENSIANSDLVFVLVSPESSKSQWLNAEIAMALSRADGRTRVVPVMLSPNVEPPFLLQNIQGITFFDPEQAQQELDRLVESIKNIPQDQKNQGAPRSFDAEIKFIQASKLALEKEKIVDASERAIRSNFAAVAITSLGTIVLLLAMAISFSHFVPGNIPSWVSFALGAFAGMAAVLLSRWWQRSIPPATPGSGETE